MFQDRRVRGNTAPQVRHFSWTDLLRGIGPVGTDRPASDSSLRAISQPAEHVLPVILGSLLDRQIPADKAVDTVRVDLRGLDTDRLDGGPSRPFEGYEDVMHPRLKWRAAGEAEVSLHVPQAALPCERIQRRAVVGFRRAVDVDVHEVG